MEKYLALKASAGSGKTFALTVRYISLLLLGAKPSEILTLTFTNKAAAEMSQRVFNTLQTLGDDEAYLNDIIKVSNFTKEQILSKKSLLIKLFINDSSSIFTIDKFVNKILREFCGYIGISDDFKIANDDMEVLSYKFLQSLDDNSFKELVEFSLYEKKKFNSIFELFKILIEKNENINKNNNINDNENGTIRFVHEETVPVNEYPEIQVIRTTGEQDVTILSLNLNGDEIFWHQKGDTLIFDQPITAKENTVKVIAVIDGRRIVHMPIWEF